MGRSKKSARRSKKTVQESKKTVQESKKTVRPLRALPVDQEYNIYIICKSQKIFKERVKTLEAYKGTKIHRFYHVPAVFLKDTPPNRALTQKLNTRHNTLMKNRLRKLGCIFAHRNALRKIVKNKTDHNVILEEDATLDHVLPNPPKESAYLGGWIIPPQITLAGKKTIRIPDLKPGLNEIKYDLFQVLMAHAYYLKSHEQAHEILESLERPGKVKNSDEHQNS